MTPPLWWVFLLALVGRAASVPASFTNDACVLLYHLMKRLSPEGVYELRRAQSGSILDEARIVISRCLKLCDHQLSFSVEVGCRTLRTLLGNHRGCHCRATGPMLISAKISSSMNELAEDIVSAIAPSSFGGRVMCALCSALFLKNVDAEGVSLSADGQPLYRLTQDTKNVQSDRHDVEHPVDSDSRDTRLWTDGDEKSTTAATDEGDIDWDLWCMNQCNNGHGGNACRCDLIL